MEGSFLIGREASAECRDWGGTAAKKGGKGEGKALQRRAVPTQVLGESGRLGGELLRTLESPLEKQWGLRSYYKDKPSLPTSWKQKGRSQISPCFCSLPLPSVSWAQCGTQTEPTIQLPYGRSTQCPDTRLSGFRARFYPEKLSDLGQAPKNKTNYINTLLHRFWRDSVSKYLSKLNRTLKRFLFD